MNNIILIGMPGSGKSTTGVVLAKTIGYSFEDTDLLISRHAGKKLQQIIDNDGTDKFMQIEEQIGSTITAEKTVIATGGSMVLSQKAMHHLKSMGTVIYLEVPIGELKRRIKNIKTRGIAFKSGETLDDIFNSRTPLYKQYADITIHNTKGNLEVTIQKIAEFIGNK